METHDLKMGKGTNALRVLLTFFSQVVIFLVILAVGQFVFATNDDSTMVAIASGGYGSPSEYVINLHILLGWIIKFLFILNNDINWVTVVFLVIIFYATLLLDVIFSSNIRNNAGFFSVVVILDLMVAIVLSYFTFTVVAYWGAIAGLIAVTYAKRKEHPVINSFGWILIGLAALVRGEAYISVLIVYFSVAAIELILYKNKRPFILAAAVGGILLLSIESNNWLTNLNPVQKEFLVWGETRSAALDCAMVPWDEVKFAEKGISECQYLAIYNAFYFCFDAIDLNVMESLIELNPPINKFNFDIMQFIINHFTIKLSFETLYRLLFTVCALFYLVMGSKRDRILVGAIWIMTLASEFVFFFIQRAVYRVVMPSYLLAVLLMLAFCRVDYKKIEKIKNLELSGPKILVCISVMLLLIGGYLRVEKYSFFPFLYSQERKEVLQYLADHPDNIYMCGDGNVLSLPVADSPLDIPAKNSYWNLIGNWETYSVPYLELMEDHKILDPYNILGESINNDHILILSNEGDDYPSTHWWILDLIRQYYGRNCVLEKVEDICENTVNESYTEKWSVYKLVEQY